MFLEDNFDATLLRPKVPAMLADEEYGHPFSAASSFALNFRCWLAFSRELAMVA
jgi:hypothetical protein